MLTAEQLRALIDESQRTIPGASYRPSGGDGWQSLTIFDAAGNPCGYMQLSDANEPAGNRYYLSALPPGSCGERHHHDAHEAADPDGRRVRCPGARLIVSGSRSWGTSGGVELTDELIERLADEAAAGHPAGLLPPPQQRELDAALLSKLRGRGPVEMVCDACGAVYTMEALGGDSGVVLRVVARCGHPGAVAAKAATEAGAVAHDIGGGEIEFRRPE